MELEKVKELVEMMKANDLSELEIVDGNTRIMLRRGGMAQVIPMPALMPSAGQLAQAAPAPAPGAAEAAAEEKFKQIVSPIVGTFYAAPSPNAEPFVTVGSRVDEDKVVCIIEAMKVMNEIKAEIRGTIRKVLVTNGQAVEYGQPLFLVEPD